MADWNFEMEARERLKFANILSILFSKSIRFLYL